MNTLSNHSKQPVPKKKRHKRQTQQQEQQLSLNPFSPEASTPQGEGVYELISQDEQLRTYHVAKLKATTGYERLSEEEATDMVAQMLCLSTLLYELLLEEENQIEQEEGNSTVVIAEKKPKRSRKK